MQRIIWSAIIGLLAAAAISAQSDPDRFTALELRGEVARVQLAPGEGAPFLEIKTNRQLHKVYLGSMRYLMVQGFNPRIGEPVVAKVYKTAHALVAATVTLPAQNRTLKLRDQHGRPVWRCCRGR